MDFDREALLAIITSRVANGITIDGSTKLTDVGFDSLDLLEVIFDIEDKFQIELPPNASELSSIDFDTLCHLAQEKVTAKGIAAPSESAS